MEASQGLLSISVLIWSTVCRPAPFHTPRLRNTTTGNVYTSCDFPKTAGWALGWERVTRNKWCQTHPLDYSSDCSESLSPRSKSYDIDVGEVRRWGVCSEVVAPIHWVHGNLVRSCAWSPVLLYLERQSITMATPAKTTTQNWKNKVSFIKMDWDVSENKSFPKCQEGCCCSFLLFNAIKMIFFF